MANKLVGLKGGGVVAQEIAVTDTTLRHTLGTIALDQLGQEYIYLKGIGSTAVADWVVYDDAYLTARMTKAEVDKLKPVAVALSANVASQYGWYQITGEATASLLTLCVKEVPLYTSGTTGSADDDSSGTTKINRAVARSTVGGSTAATVVYIDHPSAG